LVTESKFEAMVSIDTRPSGFVAASCSCVCLFTASIEDAELAQPVIRMVGQAAEHGIVDRA